MRSSILDFLVIGSDTPTVILCLQFDGGWSASNNYWAPTACHPKEGLIDNSCVSLRSSLYISEQNAIRTIANGINPHLPTICWQRAGSTVWSVFM